MWLEGDYNIKSYLYQKAGQPVNKNYYSYLMQCTTLHVRIPYSGYINFHGKTVRKVFVERLLERFCGYNFRRIAVFCSMHA